MSLCKSTNFLSYPSLFDIDSMKVESKNGSAEAGIGTV